MEDYDYVFIDCPPSLGLLTINAFVAATEVLIPIQCEYYALEGLSQLLKNIELIEKHLNPELRVSTILLTMYDSRTNLANQVAEDVRDHFPKEVLDTIIPRSVRISEAPSYGQSVISYDTNSSGSLSYLEAAAEIAAVTKEYPANGSETHRTRPRHRRPHPHGRRPADATGRRLLPGFLDAGRDAGRRPARRSGCSAGPPLPRSTSCPTHVSHARSSTRRTSRAGAQHPRVRGSAADRRAPASPAAEGKYELVMGERRLRATKQVGLDTIPAVIKDTADEDMLRDALLENLHRSNLNPLEEASAYQQLLADFGITQEELASRIGRSRPQITNTIRLLKLPSAVQTKVAAGVLTAGHARAILSVGDEASMNRLADKIVNEDLSVRAAEAAAGSEPKPVRSNATPGKHHGHLDEIAERLGDRLNTRVKISLGVEKRPDRDRFRDDPGSEPHPRGTRAAQLQLSPHAPDYASAIAASSQRCVDVAEVPARRPRSPAARAMSR